MNRKGYLLILIQIIAFNLYSQSLTDSLGGIATNFQFFSDTIDLEVYDQNIILRAEKYSASEVYDTGGAGWGYGYQSYHLEFITDVDLITAPLQNKRKNNRDRLKLMFYDANNNLLGTYSSFFNDNCLKTDDFYFYSVDLIEIPMILLDKTEKIGLIRFSAQR